MCAVSATADGSVERAVISAGPKRSSRVCEAARASSAIAAASSEAHRRLLLPVA
jgi:hypothetical protein